MIREVRISPDGTAVAIRNDQATEDAWNAWGVMHANYGGHWDVHSKISGWTLLKEQAPE